MHAHEPCNGTNLFVFDHPTTFFSLPRGNQRLPSDQRSKNAVPCDVFRLPKPCHGREFNGSYMGTQPSFSCPPIERLQSADSRDSANKDTCTAWIHYTKIHAPEESIISFCRFRSRSCMPWSTTLYSCTARKRSCRRFQMSDSDDSCN